MDSCVPHRCARPGSGTCRQLDPALPRPDAPSPGSVAAASMDGRPSAPFEKKEVCAMVPVDRQQRDAVDRLVEEYTQRGLSRRELLRRGVALGLSASIAGAILDACGASSSGGGANVKSTDLVTTWGGTEQDSFRAVVAPFTQDTG